MTSEVERHYCMTGLLTADIRLALIVLGKDLQKLEPQDLEAIDQFHIRGRSATLELAERLNILPGATVLDVGSGLGGPARTIAKEFDCHVTGIDLTRDFCDAARAISRWLGQSDAVTFSQGDAMALDVCPASFDAAITIHAAMNIKRKNLMYSGIRRALKRGGRFGIYDVVQGEYGPPHFPVPWARNPSISQLVSTEDMRALLTASGFIIEHEIDSTDASTAWFKERLERTGTAGPPPLGFQLFLGNVHAEMMKNQVRNLMERRIRTVMYVAQAKE